MRELRRPANGRHEDRAKGLGDRARGLGGRHLQQKAYTETP